jgi:hypothetical protein
MPILNAMLAGAIMASAWVICVFFVRFWKKTGDPLFACFAIAFLLLGVERVAIVFLPDDRRFIAYLIRLASFLFIIPGVWKMNNPGR